MGHRVLIIGRSRAADIRLRERSVSRLHAEFVVTDDGLLHVSDRSSANGTWIDVKGRWERLTQRTVTERDRLRFGSHVIEIAELVRRQPVRRLADQPEDGPAAGPGNKRDADDLPMGPVRRNPETGEVIAD